LVTCRHKNGQQNIMLTCFFRFSNNNFPLFLSKYLFAIFFFWPLHCQSFFDLGLLIYPFVPFVSSNISYMTLLYVFLFICSCYRCITCCYVTELYSNSNINFNIDDTTSTMNKGTESMSKQIWLSAVKCLINKTHGNLQHPIFLNK
jgi:hypothetical protein